MTTEQEVTRKLRAILSADVKGYSVLMINDEFTMKIVTALRIELTDGEQARMWGSQHKNIDVFLKAMEGNKLYRTFTKESLIRYGQLGQEIVDIDPDSTSGYLMLGWYNYRLALLGKTKNPKEHIGKAFKMAQKATSLDESDPFAHVLLGMIYSLKREYEKAIAEGERSIELFPNGAMAHGVFASTLCYADMPDEAMGHITQVIRLNPSPASWYYVTLGICYRGKGQNEQALTAYKKALHLNPKAMFNHMFLAIIYALLDRQEEADAAAKKVLEIDPNFSVRLITKAWPYKNQDYLKSLVDAMHKAGLPD